MGCCLSLAALKREAPQTQGNISRDPQEDTETPARAYNELVEDTEVGCFESKKEKKEIDRTQADDILDFQGFYTGTENKAYEKDPESNKVDDDDSVLEPPVPLPRSVSVVTAVVEKVDYEEVKEERTSPLGEVEEPVPVIAPVVEKVDIEEITEECTSPTREFEEPSQSQDEVEPVGLTEEPPETMDIEPNVVDRKAERMAIIIQERMNLEKIRLQAKEKAEKEQSKTRSLPDRRRTTLIGSVKLAEPVPWTQRRHTQPIMSNGLDIEPGSLKKSHSQVMVDLNSLLKKKLDTGDPGENDGPVEPKLLSPNYLSSKSFYFGPLAESILSEEDEAEPIEKEKKIVPKQQGEFSDVKSQVIKELNLVLKPVEDPERAHFTANLEPVLEQEQDSAKKEPVDFVSDPAIEPVVEVGKDKEQEESSEDIEHHHRLALAQEGPVIDFELEEEKEEEIPEVEHHHTLGFVQQGPLIDNLDDDKEELEEVEKSVEDPPLAGPILEEKDKEAALKAEGVAKQILALTKVADLLDAATPQTDEPRPPKNIEERKMEQLKAEGIQYYMEGRSHERSLQVLTAGTKYQFAVEKFTQIGSVELVLSSIVALIRVEMYEYAKQAIDKCKVSFPENLDLIEALESTIPYYSEQHVYANADGVDVTPRFSADGVPHARKRPNKFSI